MKNYNHKAEDLYEATGFTEKEVEALENKLNEVALSTKKFSERVEAFENEFTKKELAFAFLMFKKGVDFEKMKRATEDPRGMLAELLGLKRREKRDEKSPEELLMGMPGKA